MCYFTISMDGMQRDIEKPPAGPDGGCGTGGWTLMAVLRKGAAFLSEHRIENARLNAERLLSSVTGLSRLELYLHHEKPMNTEERDRYKALLRRRAHGEPLQYITGKCEFMSLPFLVNAHVLIPRPETETLVETIIQDLSGAGEVRILDIGSGSGNITVSLAHYLPDSKVTGADISGESLRLAQLNAQANGVEKRVQWIEADVCGEDFVHRVGVGFDAVASNPPYVSDEDWALLPAEIYDFEPAPALRGGPDGLLYFGIMAARAKDLLGPEGTLYFEVGDGQAEEVSEKMTCLGYGGIRMISDLNGITRVVAGRLGTHP